MSEQAGTAGNTLTINLDGRTWADVAQEVERHYLGHVLTQADGNRTRAAEIAGLARDTLYKKLALFKIRAVYRVE